MLNSPRLQELRVDAKRKVLAGKARDGIQGRAFVDIEDMDIIKRLCRVVKTSTNETLKTMLGGRGTTLRVVGAQFIIPTSTLTQKCLQQMAHTDTELQVL